MPAFLLDETLLQTGRFASPGRTRFLLGSLRELDAALRDRGAGLVVRDGGIAALAEVDEAVYWTGDVSPYARARDERATADLRAAGIEPRQQPGAFVADVNRVRTKDDRPFSVFSPFHRAWLRAPRRDLHGAPRRLALPPGLRKGRLPAAPPEDAGPPDPVAAPGERAARERMHAWLRDGVADYHRSHDELARPAPSSARTCTSAASRRASSRPRSPTAAGRARSPSAASWPGGTSTPPSPCAMREGASREVDVEGVAAGAGRGERVDADLHRRGREPRHVVPRDARHRQRQADLGGRRPDRL